MKRVRLIGLILFLPAIMQAATPTISDSLQQILDTLHGKNKIKMLLKLSEQNRDKSVYDCKQYFQQAMELARQEKEIQLMGQACKSMGISCYLWSDMDNAFKYFKEGLNYFRQTADKKEQSACLNDIGLVYEGRSDFDSAFYYYMASYKIEKSLGNNDGEGLSLINLGNINFYCKNYHDALKNFFEALQRFVKTQNHNGITMAYNSIAIIYTKVGEFKKAIAYLEKARKIYSITGNDGMLARLLNNMASIYAEHSKEYKKALLLYKKVLKIKTEQNDKEGIALVKCNLGALYGDLADIPMAMKYFNESRILYQAIGNNAGLSMVYMNKGKVLLDSRKYRLALQEFKKSLAISKKTGLKAYTIENYQGIFKCYAALGDYDHFNQYYSLFEKVHDTASEKLEEMRIAQLESQFKIDTLLKKQKILQEQNQLNKRKIRRYYMLTIGIPMLLAIFILAWILYRKAKKEKEQYEVKE
jgi:tetratricopeptide (TPR) repeat protein